MGAVSVTRGCAVVGALCRSSLEPGAVPGAYDWVGATDPERAQFGWWQTSIPDVSDPKYRLVDQMFLLEWATQGTPRPGAGLTALEPTAKVLVSHSIGGWNYGSWSLALNGDATTYAVRPSRRTVTS